jgi:hypothetical protein
VGFDESGKALRKHYVAWDVLRERTEHSTTSKETDPA